MAFCLCCPFTPRPLNIFHNDCAGNPLAPISTGNSQHFHPLALQSSCNWRYFAFFLSWASSHRVSQGTVSSIITMALLIMDDNTMSGLSVVWMTFGKTSFFFRSTVTSHSFASSKIDFVIFSLFATGWPSLNQSASSLLQSYYISDRSSLLPIRFNYHTMNFHTL